MLLLRDRRCRRRFREGQLAAGSHYVLSARLADERQNAFIHQNLLKFPNAPRLRPLEWQRARIPWNEVYFGSNSREQAHHAPRVLRRIIKIPKEDIFKKQPFAWPQRVFTASIQEHFQGIFP